MIETRLALCAPEGETPDVFTPAALRRIHRRTGGHPRKIVRLCHLSMLLAVGFGKPRVSWWLVGRAEREAAGGRSLLSRLPRLPRYAAGGAACAGLALALFLAGSRLSELPGLSDLSRVAKDAATRLDSVLAAPAQPAAAPSPSAPQAQALYAPELAGVMAAEPSAPARPQDAASPALDVASAPAPSSHSAPRAPSVVHAPPANPTALEGLGASLALSAAALPAQGPAAKDSGHLGRAVPAVTTAAATTAAAEGAPTAAGLVAADAPETLGQTVVRPGWAATRLASRVYGNGGRSVMSRLAKANPNVDFSRIRTGETIVFPAIAAQPLPEGACMVRVASVDSLDKGLAFISRHAGVDPALALYCVHVPGVGMRFDVVSAALYANRESAETALSELPGDIAGQAEVVDRYPSGSTAFTDLGPWNGRRGSSKLAQSAPRTQARQVADGATAMREAQP